MNTHVHIESIVLGSRADACDVVVHGDPYISPRHCRITRDPYPAGDGSACRIFVEDLGSTNGTYINDHRIYGPIELRIGDHLRIGRTVSEIPPYAFWRET